MNVYKRTGWAFHILENGIHKTFVFDTKDQGYAFLWVNMDADCLDVTYSYGVTDLDVSAGQRVAA